MPHVELSLTEDASRLAPVSPERSQTAPESMDTPGSALPGGALPGGIVPGGALARWAAATSGATEPSLVISTDTCVVAASATCGMVLGFGDPANAIGRPLREALGNLVDFTASLAQLDNAEADKIPPLLAIASGRLARGLMRVVCTRTSSVNTLDAIATPLWDGSTVVGSLSFFSKV